MALETGNYINDLVITNPTSTDPKSAGDDHLRLIKTTIKNSFPNLVGSITPNQNDLNTLTNSATTGASGLNVTTQALGNSSTLAASTAFVAATAFSSALPAQTGNAGKFVTTNGITASWSYAGISTVNSTITTSATLSGTYLYVPVAMTALGQSVTLPAANTLSTGGPQYIIDNTKGGYPVGIRDNTGTLIMAVAAGGEAFVALKDNSTPAGVWSVTGTNLEPGLITIDNTFSSTYSSTVQAPFVALDANTSIHFAALSSGFAAFVVDNAGKVISTPVTVSSTANDLPYIAFKVSSTSVLVHYANATAYNTVVLSLTGTSPSYSLSVGTPAALTAPQGTNDRDSLIGAPKFIQLSGTSYLHTLTTAGGATQVQAVSVTGTAISVGTATSIIAASSVYASITAYPLTSTTALVLYKSGGAAPYANNAVVISVSGTTCTVGTPAALTGCASSLSAAPSSCQLSATKVLVQDDNNVAGSVIASAVTISGTTVTAGTALSVETGITTSFSYSSNNATRSTPHLWMIGSNSAGLWYLDSNSVSRVVVLNESAGTITAGAIQYRSISSATSNSSGFGSILPQGTAEFCSTIQRLANTAGYSNVISINKISGSTITTGNSIPIPSASANPISLHATRLSGGKYVYHGMSDSNNNMSSWPVFSSNGDAINYAGAISAPLLNDGVTVPRSVSSNRLVFLGTAYYGGTAGAATYSLRLINVEIAA
ncbi:MAG: hypothetical protein ACXWAT_00055 [Methylobacter sp.]